MTAVDVPALYGWMVDRQEYVAAHKITLGTTIYINSEQRNIYTTGSVADTASLSGPRVLAPYVTLNSSGEFYTGTAGGISGGAVELYKAADILYRYGTRFPVVGGTWTSDISTESGIHFALLVADEGASPTRATYAMSGTVAPGDHYLSDYEIGVYARSDIDYRTDKAGLEMVTSSEEDGTVRVKVPPTYVLDSDRFVGYGFLAPTSTLIVRLLQKPNFNIINSSEYSGVVGYQGIIQSFFIPPDDPAGRSEGDLGAHGYRLELRSWIYDDAVAIIAFTAYGDTTRAKRVLDALVRYDARDTGSPALAFSYDTYLGLILERYLRSGAIAWVGMAINYYTLKTGDRSYLPLAIKQAAYLLSLQDSTGSIRGGWGGYDNGYVARKWNPETLSYLYDPTHPDPLHVGDSLPSLSDGFTWQLLSYQFFGEEKLWHSTEHNIDSYFFFRDLAKLTSNAAYTQAAKDIKQSLLTNHWNADEHRFNQGTDDPGRALDVGTWGGLFLDAIGESTRARQSTAYVETYFRTTDTMTLSTDPGSYNTTYHTATTLDGYKPYAPNSDPAAVDQGTDYSDAPDVVWAEGTFGALLLYQRLGITATSQANAMGAMQDTDPQHGIPQVSHGHAALPYEFHPWPALAAAAWGVAINSDPTAIFSRDLMPPVWAKADDGTWVRTAIDARPLKVKINGSWIEYSDDGPLAELVKTSDDEWITIGRRHV